MRHASLATVLLPLALVACSSGSGKGPVLATSAGQSSYAVHYAEERAAATRTVEDALAQEKAIAGGLPARVDELKKPDWDKVLLIIDASDEAGRSADFAAASGDADRVKAFWDAEKDAVTGRVNGAALHTAKEANCTAELSGPIAYALNEGMTKQLQKRLRGRNDAFLVIERNKTVLGPQNVAALEKLADDISRASYDVNVVMVAERGRLERLVADKDDVKKTLDRFVQEETAYQAEPGRTEADKKASADRVTAANKTKAEVDASASLAENVLKQMDESTAAAKKDYENALKELRAKVAEKKKAEPPAAKTK